ncbi:hypothetical protein CTRI78_v009532 [Colletotrichum trifolii]|uniref:Uncharacterized protein n=1 Tax=Colletotrichum trifolii TaxID=5466 RepID=A0A4R8QXR0_COLTR|nr:hypothetical protein CTRI78_v009532 [Colletotrichum trifolii]
MNPELVVRRFATLSIKAQPPAAQARTLHLLPHHEESFDATRFRLVSATPPAPSTLCNSTLFFSHLQLHALPLSAWRRTAVPRTAEHVPSTGTAAADSAVVVSASPTLGATPSGRSVPERTSAARATATLTRASVDESPSGRVSI